MAERITPDNPLSFIRECIRDRRVLWTYHVNMRFRQRFVDREMIIHAADNYELIEEYPDDKYFPSYLVLGRSGQEVFHVLFGADVEGENVRIITAYYPSLDDWEQNFKIRKGRE